MSILSGFIDSLNPTIAIFLFPLLAWDWVSFQRQPQKKSQSIIIATILNSYRVAPWLAGLVLSFFISITFIPLLNYQMQKDITSFSGLAFGIIAYLNWKSSPLRLNKVISFSLGMVSAQGWNPVVSRDLAIILLASLQKEWSFQLFLTALFYSIGIGILLMMWVLLTTFIVVLSQKIFLKISIPRLNIFKDQLSKYSAKSPRNNITWLTYPIKLYRIIFSISTVHIILFFYGLAKFTGILDIINLWLLQLAWKI